jgi:hypothetical protein
MILCHRASRGSGPDLPFSDSGADFIWPSARKRIAARRLGAEIAPHRPRIYEISGKPPEIKPDWPVLNDFAVKLKPLFPSATIGRG